MLRALSLLAAAILVAAMSGCVGGGSDDSTAPADTSPLTAAELGWIRAYSAWTIEIYDDEADHPTGSRAVQICRDRVEEIGDPPTERLDAAAELAPTVCSLLARQGTLRRARDIIEEADGLVLPYLRDEQLLQLRTGITQDSRADIDLSELASEMVERPVEVRCWSNADWRRVVGEDNAWNDDSADYEDLVGWSDDSADRIHLVLDHCNTIARVDAGDVEAWSRDDQIDAADAVETLAHEIQHFLTPDAEEATVECQAIRSLPRFAQRFGVASALAVELTELYRTEVYPNLDDEYTEGGCPRQG